MLIIFKVMLFYVRSFYVRSPPFISIMLYIINRPKNSTSDNIHNNKIPRKATAGSCDLGVGGR